MKKYVKFLLLILCAFLVVGCAKDEKSDKKEETKKSEKLAIEETVLYETEDANIVAKSIKTVKSVGYEIELTIDNNTDKDLTYVLETFEINGILVDNAALYSEISAGKSANESIYLSKADLEFAGIEKIKDIDFVISASDENYDDVFVTDVMSLSTNVGDYDQKINKDGKELVNQNGLTIITMEDGEDDFGLYVKVFLENTSDKDIIVSMEDVSVNGVMLDPYFYVELPANSKTYTKISFDEDDLDDNDIEELEKIVFDLDSYDLEFDDFVNLKDLVIEIK